MKMRQEEGDQREESPSFENPEDAPMIYLNHGRDRLENLASGYVDDLKRMLAMSKASTTPEQFAGRCQRMYDSVADFSLVHKL